VLIDLDYGLVLLSCTERYFRSVRRGVCGVRGAGDFSSSGAPDRLQLEFQVEQVGEFDFEAVGAAAVVAEVDLAQGLGGDLAELVLGETGLLGLEEACGVVGGQREGEVRTRASSVLPGAAV
jgi:hypothetical protein